MQFARTPPACGEILNESAYVYFLRARHTACTVACAPEANARQVALANVKVGDKVDIVWTEAVLVSVERK